MSIRYFCDGCGKEMRSDEKNAAMHTDGAAVRFYYQEKARLKVGIVAWVDGGANSGHVCVPCAKEVIDKGWEVAR